MGFPIDTYQRRRRNKENWTPQQEDLDAFVKESCDILAGAGSPYNISVGHGNYGPNRNMPFIRARLPQLLKNEPPGTPIVVAAQKGDAIVAYAFRRVRHVVEPANTEGSPDMDMIHAAVVAEFGGRGWGLVSVGLYVNKPGEHGAIGNGWKGNAEDWEFNDSPSDTAGSDARLDELGKWLYNERNALPIGGVISQGEAWSIFYSGWEPYKSGYDRFTRHYTHVHVSGKAHDLLSGWF